MIPPIADSDPDPTSQIPWPSRGRVPARVESSAVKKDPVPPIRPRRMSAVQERRLFSTWDLITLSISMAGAQIAWTVELG